MQRSVRLVLATALLAAPLTLRAMFMNPSPAPVDRLIQNTEAYIARNPEQAEAYYTLGRIHYLAFVLQLEAIPAYRAEPDKLPSVAAHERFFENSLDTARRAHAEELARAELGLKADIPDDPNERQRFFQSANSHFSALTKEGWQPDRMPLEKSFGHAEKAAAAFRKAIALDPKNGLYPLGLGSLLEQFAGWTEDSKVEPPAGALTDALTGDLHAKARDNFFSAWSLSYPGDAKKKSLPLGGLSDFVSYEAGQAFLELAEKNLKAFPANQRAALPRVRAAIAKLEGLPEGAITPLIVALTPHTHLDELLAPAHPVEFDLRGFGVAERWPWVKADAGLLVWDPQDRRTITSGRQLFGSYTFQLFWRTGYDALRALDDNGDGQLTGAELDGISVWFDRNGDGRSSRGEVIPLTALGISALAVDASGFDGPHPTNSRGVTFTDGRTLPTWDWIATPVRESAP